MTALSQPLQRARDGGKIACRTGRVDCRAADTFET